MYFELKQILNVKLKLACEENSFDSPERNRGYRNSHDFSLLKNFISSFFFFQGIISYHRNYFPVAANPSNSSSLLETHI